jgi:hypothetical protein
VEHQFGGRQLGTTPWGPFPRSEELLELFRSRGIARMGSPCPVELTASGLGLSEVRVHRVGEPIGRVLEC